MRILWLLLLLALPVLSDSAVRTVEIKVSPPEGSAFCRYEADGKMHGGHASPPPAVRVYEEAGKLEPAVLEQVWKLAGEVKSQGTAGRPGNSVVITLADGTTRVASWPWKEEPSDPKLRELANLLQKHHVGGW